MTKIGNGSIPLRLGNLINTTVYGGPYRTCPSSMFGVKMAEEIKAPHDVSIPTRDFCVPEMSDMRQGVMRALMAMVQGEDVYAGCMGGIGRTGLFLGVLAKIQSDYRAYKHRPGRGVDPVDYVREHFIPHAIETDEQQAFVRNFETDDIVEWIDVTQRAMGLGGMTPPKVGAVPTRESFDFLQDNNDPLSEMAALVERDLDWIDNVEADSADEAQEVSVQDQVNDIWAYLDEMDDQLETFTKIKEQVAQLVAWRNNYPLEIDLMPGNGLHLSVPARQYEVSREVSDVEKSEEEGLTNPTIFERLRSFWK